ncbi:MAG: carbon-nitrogen hydrolase family protein [Chloroflexi bacterium]|nr:carbon-nitrogen hydrolase family protein [Chloroflexota bacterium]
MLVAGAQLEASADYEESLARGREAIATAAHRGASLVVLPELYMAWTPTTVDPAICAALAQPLDGPFVRGLAEAARDNGVWVVSGMIERPCGDSERAYNTIVVLDARGNLAASYRKTHLYDAFGYEESRALLPGNRLFEPMESPLGCTGLLVCYELRFPEVARHQVERGAEVLLVPSAWIAGPMKEHHWRSLVVARAIENTAYVVAIDQVGNQFIGQSLVVDPMGVVLAEGPEVEGIVYAEIDPGRVSAVREKVPSLRHRRPELFT